MPNSEAIEKIKKLTDQEREVFKLFCNDLFYRDIGKELYIKETTVKKHMSNIRIKFGIDKMNRRKRDSVLRNNFCLALQNLENQEQEKDIKEGSQTETESKDSNKKTVTDTKIIEDNVLEEKTPEKEKPKEDEFEKVEKEDGEKPLYHKKKEPLNEKKDGNQMKKTGERKNDRFRSLKIAWRLISIAAIVFGGYMIYDHFFGPTSVQPASSPEEPGVQPEEIQPTAIPNETVIVPTEPPTPAPTLPPQPAILFEDNFENGLSSGWEIVSGNPMIVNGKLTTDQDTWLLVGDPSWNNVSVEFNTNFKRSTFGTGTSFNGIGVRVQDVDNMYFIRWGEYKNGIFIIEDGNWNELPKTDYAVLDKEVNLRVTVVDGQVTLYDKGVKALSFFDTRFESGRVAVHIFANSTFDDFKIKEILE